MIKIAKVELKADEEYYWEFTTEGTQEEKIIIPKKVIDELIRDYLRRHTYLGR